MKNKSNYSSNRRLQKYNNILSNRFRGPNYFPRRSEHENPSRNGQRVNRSLDGSSRVAIIAAWN